MAIVKSHSGIRKLYTLIISTLQVTLHWAILGYENRINKKKSDFSFGPSDDTL